jgi:hypothetical protein
MSERTRTWAGAAVLFIGSAVFLAGSLAHPFVRDYMDTTVVADAVSAAPGQWAVAHVILAVGLGLVLLAVLVIREQFRGPGELRWSAAAVPLLIVGATLFGAIVGSEITLAAVVDTGGDVLAVREATEALTLPLVLAGFLLFGLGWLCFAMAFYRARILPSALNWLAIVALVAIPIASFIPQTLGTYAYGLAILMVSWLVGYHMIAERPLGPGIPRPVDDERRLPDAVERLEKPN